MTRLKGRIAPGCAASIRPKCRVIVGQSDFFVHREHSGYTAEFNLHDNDENGITWAVIFMCLDGL